VATCCGIHLDKIEEWEINTVIEITKELIKKIINDFMQI
jgi:hypothetical protein